MLSPHSSSSFIISEYQIPQIIITYDTEDSTWRWSIRSIVEGLFPTEDKSGGSEATDPDVWCVSVTYDEDCSIEGPDILAMRFPLLTCVSCTELVNFDPSIRLTLRNKAIDEAHRRGKLQFQARRNEIIQFVRMRESETSVSKGVHNGNRSVESFKNRWMTGHAEDKAHKVQPSSDWYDSFRLCINDEDRRTDRLGRIV